MGASIPKYIADDIADHLGAIADHFKPTVFVTLLVRNPDVGDGDLIMTRDSIEAVLASIRKTARVP